MHGREKRFAELITPGLATPTMCGIVGCVAEEPVAGILLEGLRRVEYRGYDSAGMATISGNKIRVRKGAGKVNDLEVKLGFSSMNGNVGIAHCLHPDTLVQLADGRLKRIEDMEDEEDVMSFDPATLRIVSSKAKRFWHAAPSRLLRITTGSSEIVCTGEHRMIVVDNGGIEERPASALAPGNLLILPKHLKLRGTPMVLQEVPTKNYVRMKKTWSADVRSAMKERRLTVTAAARAFGVSEAYLTHVIANDRSFREEAIVKISEKLGVRLEGRSRPTSHSHGNYTKLPVKTSPQLLRFLGYAWGDGHFRTKGIRIREEDPRLLTLYGSLARRLFGIRPKICKLPRQNAYELSINSGVLNRWFTVNFGPRSPSFLWKAGLLTDREIASFIAGVFDAEGAVNTQSKQVLVRMTDSNVVSAIHLFLVRFGIHSSLRVKRLNEAWQPVSILTISGHKNLVRFAREIGTKSTPKRRKLKLAIKGTVDGLSFRELAVPFTKLQLRGYSVAKGIDHYLQRNEYPTHGTVTMLIQGLESRHANLPLETLLRQYEASDVQFEKIERISETIPDVERVYDLEVKGTSNFLANGIFTHNSRWATHGGVTDRNAHPHTACNETVAVIHNGIIENYLSLKKRLTSKGHRFKSETDTEVIAHLIEDEYAKTKDPLKATMRATKKLTGQYAIAVLFQDRPDVIIGARKDAPLIVGVGDGMMFIASDVLAFIEHTDRTVFLDNQETVEITKSGLKIVGWDGREVRRRPTQVAWELSDLSKASYAHYTLKEINEQPQTVVGASVQDPRRVTEFASVLLRAKSLFITGSGTSYHAGLLMKSRLNQEAGIRCDVVVSGELREHSGFLVKGSVVVVLSQSGETADVLEAVKEARRRGAKILSIVNAAGSTLARESDLVLLLNCGPEVGVAATKSFTAQVVVANMVVDAVLGKKRTNGIQELSEAITKALEAEKQIKEIVQRYKDKSDFYFVARGYQSPVALEGALKLKELSYVHAEGMPASELKHGTLALIEKGTPVVVINPSGDTHADSLSNSEELKARGADLIGISDVADEVYRYFIHVPKVQAKFMPVVEVVPLQLLAYHFAVARKNDPDYPRNLAKSVTVK